MSSNAAGVRLCWDVQLRNGVDVFFSEECYNQLCNQGTLEEQLLQRITALEDKSKVIKYDRNQDSSQEAWIIRGEEQKLESAKEPSKKQQCSLHIPPIDTEKSHGKELSKPTDKTTIRDNGSSVFISNAFIPPPRKSCLNHAQQICYLDLQAKYGFRKSHDTTEEELIEIREFTALNTMVLKEQAEFQDYLKKLAQCNHREYEYIHPETKRYIEEYLGHRKREVECYPKYYNSLSSFPIEGMGQHSNLVFIKPLLQLGHVQKMVLPNLSQGQCPQIPLDANVVGKQYPSVPLKSTDQSKWSHEQCSRDENAEYLAVTNQAHIVISPGALQCLVDNQAPKFLREWELPVTVKEYDVRDGEKIVKHRVVYVDRPFAPKQLNDREKNEKYYKFALKAFFSRSTQKGTNSGPAQTTTKGRLADKNISGSQRKTSVTGDHVKDSVVKNSDNKSTRTHKNNEDNTSCNVGKSGRTGMFDTDVFSCEEASMGDLETFGMESKYSIGKKKFTPKLIKQDQGRSLEAFSGKLNQDQGRSLEAFSGKLKQDQGRSLEAFSGELKQDQGRSLEAFSGKLKQDQGRSLEAFSGEFKQDQGRTLEAFSGKLNQDQGRSLEAFSGKLKQDQGRSLEAFSGKLKQDQGRSLEAFSGELKQDQGRSLEAFSGEFKQDQGRSLEAFSGKLKQDQGRSLEAFSGELKQDQGRSLEAFSGELKQDQGRSLEAFSGELKQDQGRSLEAFSGELKQDQGRSLEAFSGELKQDQGRSLEAFSGELKQDQGKSFEAFSGELKQDQGRSLEAFSGELKQDQGRSLEAFSGKFIASPNSGTSKLELRRETTLPGLSTSGSAFTKVSKSCSYRSDSLLNQKTGDVDSEKPQNQSSSPDRNQKIVKIGEDQCTEIAPSESLCTEDADKYPCVSGIRPPIPSENHVESKGSCSQYQSIVEEKHQVAGWSKPIVLGSVSIDKIKNVHNSHLEHAGHTDQLPRQRHNSASSCDSDKLVIDSCEDLTLEEEIDTPASPNPASPDQIGKESLHRAERCRIIPVGRDDCLEIVTSPTTDRSSPTSPVATGSCDWAPCKIIPLQRDSEDENIIDNSHTTDTLTSTQSTVPVVTSPAKSRSALSKLKGQTSALSCEINRSMETLAKSTVNIELCSSSCGKGHDVITHTARSRLSTRQQSTEVEIGTQVIGQASVDPLTSDVDSGKESCSTKLSLNVLTKIESDRSETEPETSKMENTENVSMEYTRITRSRRSVESCMSVGKIEELKTDTSPESRRKRGRRRKTLTEESSMATHVTTNDKEFCRKTRSKSMEVEKSSPEYTGIGSKAVRKRGRPRRNLSSEVQSPSSAKILRGEKCESFIRDQHDRRVSTEYTQEINVSVKQGCDPNTLDVMEAPKLPVRRRGRPRKHKTGDSVDDSVNIKEDVTNELDDSSQGGTSAAKAACKRTEETTASKSDSNVEQLDHYNKSTHCQPQPSTSKHRHSNQHLLPNIPVPMKTIFSSVLQSSIGSHPEDFETSLKSSGYLDEDLMSVQFKDTTSSSPPASKPGMIMEKSEKDSYTTEDRKGLRLVKEEAENSDIDSKPSHDTKAAISEKNNTGCAVYIQTGSQTLCTSRSAISQAPHKVPPPPPPPDGSPMKVSRRRRISRISKADDVPSTNQDTEMSPLDGSRGHSTAQSNTQNPTCQSSSEKKKDSTNSFSLDSLLQMQEKMLQPKPSGPHQQQQPTEEDHVRNFKTPDRHNVNYNLWSLGGFLVLIRCGYHGYIRDVNQQNSYVHVMPKLEYQTKYGWEQITYSEAVRSWISSYIRPNSKLLRVRVSAQKSEVLSIEELTVAQTVSQIFNPATSFLMLQNIFHKLHQLETGKYLLQHVTSSNKCVIKKCTEDNKRGGYDLHFAHLGFVSTEATSGKKVPWIPVDPTIRLPYHTKNGRIPVTFEPKDFQMSKQKAMFNKRNKGKNKKKKKKGKGGNKS